MREEARLKEADDADSHHIAVAKFMQKVLLVTIKFYCVCACRNAVLTQSRSCTCINKAEIVTKVGEISQELYDKFKPKLACKHTLL